MAALVIAEHDHKSLKSPLLNTITAALMLGRPVSVLVAGKEASGAAQEAASVGGVSEVLYADDAAYDGFLAENMAALIAKLAPSYSHILAPATSFGKNILPRAAGLCGCAQISDIIGIESEDTFVRPIYAGNAIATVKSTDKIKFITVRSTAFDKATRNGKCSVKKIEEVEDSGLSRFIAAQKTQTNRPDLTVAAIIVSGGRGLESAEKFKTIIEPLADKLGAAIGASRAAVDAGYISNDCQIGQTGKVVAPNLYIAIGLSGAIQHLAGMKDSKTIVAVNKDPDAPIFAVADYGIVGDLFEIVPELTKAI
ncbi:MAG: FAD-binding protein [Bdellovibrionales bacterium]